MKNSKLTYAFLIVILTALWLMADTIVSAPYEFYAVRTSLAYYTGILAIGVMSAGMMLAIRPAIVEPFLGGLDKSYRLHKWLGVTGLVMSVAHWLCEKLPKWMEDWGWLTEPDDGPEVAPATLLLRLIENLSDLAEDVGEWGFYAVVTLVALALLKRFPYRYFFMTHRLLALVYLVLVFHSAVLMKFSYWSEGLGPLMALLMAGGCTGAVISLFRRVGFERRAVGVIEELVHHQANWVLKVAIALKDRWPGHQAGQFAFVTFDHREGPHPFTISSSWHDDGKMTFLIKGIGDYTSTLPAALKVGDLVKLEGPYGRFCFTGKQQRQIWVAGGIGITPFVARMQALAAQPDGKSIDLFYSTSVPDDAFIQRLTELAQQANVRLHILVAGKDGRLTTKEIFRVVPEWHLATVWFCGPAGFGQILRQDFIARGLASGDFHQELFDMR
jgi:predicted ferric reductase